MRYIFFLLLFAQANAQIGTKLPQLNIEKTLGVGRTSNNDTAAYFQIGPNSGGNKGMGLPRLANTNVLLGTPFKGLFVYDNSRDLPAVYNGTKWVYWDTTAGSISLPSTVFQYSDNINVTVADSTTDLVLNQTTPNSASRVITLKSPALEDLNQLKIYNYNNSIYLNTVATNIIDFDGTPITTLDNQATYILQSDGSYWRVLSKTKLVTGGGGTGGSSGVELINLD